MVKKGYVAGFVIYLLILFDTGGIYARSFYILLLCLLVFLYSTIRHRGYIIIEGWKIAFWKTVIFFSGLFAAMSGIDVGESVNGIVRLIAVLLTSIALRQIDDECKDSFLKVIPYLGILLLICSLFLMNSSGVKWISATKRVAGPFEYPNTMALFLLIGIVVLENVYVRGKRILQFFLSIGILATGCRTMFLLCCLYLFYCFVKCRGKNFALIILFSVAILGIVLLGILGKDVGGFDRFRTLDLNTSTFQGRLLYWEDACRMLLKYPQGLGSMGYFYLQQVMQTGMYSVRFVHNDWLQLMLDYGVLAGIGTFACLASAFWKMSLFKKELLVVIAASSFFDFHMQYLSIIIILLLLEPCENPIIKRTNMKWRYVNISALIIVTVCIIVKSMAWIYAEKGYYEEAVKWDRLSTQYKADILLNSPNLEIADYYAGQLLEGNSLFYAAYLVKSNAAAANRQIDVFIENRKQVLKLKKYSIEEYNDYFRILLEWYMKAYNENNEEEMKKCLDAMKEIPELILMVKRDTSVRAYKIEQMPELFFDKKYQGIINILEGRKRDD